MKCEMCGIGGVVLPFGARTYTWLHHECWERWRNAGFPSLRRETQSTYHADPAVEKHCRLAFASWDEFSDEDKAYWRAKYQPILRGNDQDDRLATLVA